MEPSIKIKDSNSNVNALGTAAASAVLTVNATGTGSTTTPNTNIAISHICSSDSFSIIPPPHHELVSANSIELNAAASLSDDSGVPLTTNSSISSGDSYRIGMCKFEIEMVESDGEVSQFDSLDNCSEGGMSAENFNTLKKGPLAPIDPPPEFQDSPQTTLVRSISKNIVNSLRRWTSSQSSFEHLKDYNNGTVNGDCLNNVIGNDLPILSLTPIDNNIVALDGNITCHIESTDGQDFYALNEKTLKESYAINKHLYSSDSILNSHTDNIYDEPNNIISTSLGNSVDIIESDTSSPLPSPPPPVSIIKIKQTLCPYYQDRYFKAIPSEQDNITKAAQRFNTAGLSEIHDYDLYYSVKRNIVQQQYENSLQRRLLYSPLSHHTHHCHYHHHAVVSSCCNRPNSRNSLSSRLSSSHNSLNISSANKPDDSIFITQAMSHDALFTREISDFYNVPIDSDIYAFPVDMIQNTSDKDGKTTHVKENVSSKHLQRSTATDTECIEHSIKCPIHTIQQQQCQAQHQQEQSKSNRRNNRNKHKKRYSGNGGTTTSTNETSDECGERSAGAHKHNSNNIKYRSPASVTFHSENEPLHMTLDEVKQFYHTLYSDTKSTAGTMSGISLHHAIHTCSAVNKGSGVKTSNETIWSISSTTTTTTTSTRCDLSTARSEKHMIRQRHNLDNDKLNNNNNNTVGIIINQQSQTHFISSNYQQSQIQQQQQLGPSNQTQVQDQMQHLNTNTSNIILPNNKHILHTEKKSQFTLNLKQKFCSIFRFRRNHNRCRSNTNANANTNTNSENDENCEDRRKKFQSRALPPLPKKPHKISEGLEQTLKDEKKPTEPRSLQFTSSIEKVKDYGWYWGPLSSEAAEKVLSNEPDGSFIVRDSSDDHYIFSLSFKLNNCVRHVRIEQDQGTFSFGSYAKFKSQTITEFIEKAVEHSRSGRYLFFLHRRPEHGPMRVQLTNPVSRFKHVQSLQHMCRFVILKAVKRKDLIPTLPLPRRLLDYLNYKHCYSEQVESDSSHSQISGDGGSI